MLKFDINAIIEVKKEKEAYLKKWFLYGLFGRHKIDEGKKLIGFLYAFVMLTSIVLLSLSAYYFMVLLIRNESDFPLWFVFLTGIILNISVTVLWANDLLKKMKYYDSKIKHLEKGEN